MLIDFINKSTPADTRPPKERDYIGFSDLGGAFADRYLKMKAEPVSNPFDARTLQVFEIGKALETMVLIKLIKAGILNKYQPYLEIPATDKTLKLLGYADCTVGGFPSQEIRIATTLKFIEEFHLVEEGQNILDLVEQYTSGECPPEEIAVEIKTINSKAIWWQRNSGGFQGYDHHKLQLYGYMKALGLEKGIILYCPKDDATLQEVALIRNDKLDKMFQEDVEEMTRIYKSGEMPKVEAVVYNFEKKKWEINWKLSRSNYLEKITGFKDKFELERYYAETIKNKNKAITN